MNAPFRSIADGLPRRRFSVDDVYRMVETGLLDEDERLELLDGEIVLMASKGIRHESVKAAIVMFWGRSRPDGFGFTPETTLRLDAYNFVEPDFIVFGRSGRLGDVRGPDVLLAVEVADSSLGYDLYRKPPIYAAHGVRELWVIDAARRKVHVHRDRNEDGYADIREHGSTDRLTPAFAPAEFAFALDDLPDI